MSRVVGETSIRGQSVRILEEPIDTLASPTAEPFVVLDLQGVPPALDLDDVRKLRALLGRAEQRLLLRLDQATRARNGVLDLG